MTLEDESPLLSHPDLCFFTPQEVGGVDRLEFNLLEFLKCFVWWIWLSVPFHWFLIEYPVIVVLQEFLFTNSWEILQFAVFVLSLLIFRKFWPRFPWISGVLNSYNITRYDNSKKTFCVPNELIKILSFYFFFDVIWSLKQLPTDLFVFYLTLVART